MHVTVRDLLHAEFGVGEALGVIADAISSHSPPPLCPRRGGRVCDEVAAQQTVPLSEQVGRGSGRVECAGIVLQEGIKDGVLVGASVRLKDVAL